MSLWHRFSRLRLLLNLNERTLQMAASLDDIQSALAAQADKIAALEARVTAQGVAPDPAKLQTIADTVTANNAKIDAIAPAPTPPADTPPAPAQ